MPTARPPRHLGGAMSNRMLGATGWMLLLVGCPEANQGDNRDTGDNNGYEPLPPQTILGDTKFGYLVVTSGEVPASGPDNHTTTATAGFTDTGGQVQECVRHQLSADCVEDTCNRIDGSQFQAHDAGTLDVTGLREPVQLVEGSYEGIYTSLYVTGEASYYLPGEDVTLTASGATVPAFTLTTAAPDQSLEVIEPPPAAAGAPPLTVPWNEDLRYVFTAPSNGTVTVELLLFSGPDEERVITCSRLGDPLIDEVIVPLSKRDAFNAEGAIESIRYASTASTVAGDFPVYLELASAVVTADGAPYLPRTLVFE